LGLLERWVNELEETDDATQANGKQSAGERMKLIDELASKIATLWYKSTKTVYHTAVACAEAARRLGPEQKKLLLKKLPFGESTFSKLVQIGKDSRIHKFIKKLPPSYSTIYLVSQLSDEQLKVGIETGIVNAEASREDIKKLRDAGGQASEPRRARNQERVREQETRHGTPAGARRRNRMTMSPSLTTRSFSRTTRIVPNRPQRAMFSIPRCSNGRKKGFVGRNGRLLRKLSGRGSSKRFFAVSHSGHLPQRKQRGESFGGSAVCSRCCPGTTA
jgi:hypothetical protein